MRVRGSEQHHVPERPPLVLTPGEVVTVGSRNTRWPAFVLVTSAHGEGWVPARLLSAGAGPAVVKCRYDTTELAVETGQEVTILERDDESGWWWCLADDGSVGWVPVSVFDRRAPDEGGQISCTA